MLWPRPSADTHGRDPVNSVVIEGQPALLTASRLLSYHGDCRVPHPRLDSLVGCVLQKLDQEAAVIIAADLPRKVRDFAVLLLPSARFATISRSRFPKL